MTREYYEINEDAARQAKAMWSHSDYVMGSKTEEYKKAVDEAYDLVDKIKEQRPRSAEKAEHIAKKYAKKLAENYNDGFRIEMMCPSILISGAGNFPVKKKEKQNEARDRNLKEHNQILGYIDKLKDIVIDIAFVPLDPRQENQYAWGMDYFMKHTHTKYVFPMHMWGDYEVYDRLMENPEAEPYKERVIEVKEPGQVFEVNV